MNPIDHDYSKEAGSTTLHNQFKKEFEIYVPQHFVNVMVIPYDVGFVRAYSEPEKAYMMGMEGVLDTIVVLPQATFFFDVKTGGNKLTKKQLDFCIAIKKIYGSNRAFKINSCSQGIALMQSILALI